MPMFLMLGRSSTRRLWKGRDRRTFRSAVVALVWEELALRNFAHTHDPGDQFSVLFL